MKTKASKRILAVIIALMMILPVIPAMTVSAAAPFYRAVSTNGVDVSATTAPDGQAAYIWTIKDGARLTNEPQGDWSNAKDMYFVFDVYTGGANITLGGDFAVTKVGATSGWWGQGTNFFSIIKGSNTGNWATYYVPMTLAQARIEGGKPTDLSVLDTVRAFGSNFSRGNLVGNLIIKNPRFQDNQYSTPIATLVSKTSTTLEVSATAASGQVVEFAINAANTVPTTGWVTGTLTGGAYVAEFDSLTPGGVYNVFTRTVADGTYNFTGTAYSAIMETEATDDIAVGLAKAALTWNVIRNANTLETEVTTALTLSTTGTNGTTISWASDDVAINASTGAVTRPMNGIAAPGTPVTLTATITKGLETDTVVFNLIVSSDFNDQDAVNDTVGTLTWSAIKSVNVDAQNVIAGITLPTTTTNGTTITWASTNNDVINTQNNRNTSKKEGIPAGVVFRQATDTTVTVTATVRRGTASATVPFVLTVPAADPAACQLVVNGPNFGNYTANGISACMAGDSTAPSINNYATGTNAPGWTLRPGDFMYFWIDNPTIKQSSKVKVDIEVWQPSNPSFQLQYCSAYSGSDEGTAYALYNGIPSSTSTSTSGVAYRTRINLAGNTATTGNYYRFTFILDRCNFNLTDGSGNPIGQNKKAQFRLTSSGTNLNIKKITITDIAPTNAEAVEVVKSGLTWDVIKGLNTNQSAAISDLNLITAGDLNTAISWASSNTAIIDVDGTVVRPINDTNVTLTATISRADAGSTAASDTQAIIVTVRGDGSDVSDADAVANMKAALIWDVIKSGNVLESEVTTNLFLPTMGVNATDITWSSDLPAVISNAGVVTRDATLDKAVTFTATITRGTVSDTVVFNLTVASMINYAASMKPTIQTLYPTKDWVVSDFNVKDYGAKTVAEDPTFDNRLAFQAAIDAAYNNGGGVVWIPAGNYAFRSENTSGITLDLKQSVTLRGDWANPEDNNGAVLGTVLEVYSGKGRGLDRNNAQGTNGCFIAMVQGTGVTNLSIWYPEQDINNVVAYPWSIKQLTGDSATVENVTFVNSYGAFRASPAELHYVYNSYITALAVGIEVHTCTDIGRIENIKIDPKYWAESGLAGAPTLAEVTAYTKANGRGFGMHRSDWEYLSDLYITGYKEGMWIGREPSGTDTPNAQFYRMYMEDCGTALYVDAVNPYGLLISDSVFKGTGDNSRAAYFSSSFSTSVQFNTVDFEGPIVCEGSGGVISFENCTFDYSGGYDLTINRGSVLLSNSSFATEDKHVYLGRATSSNGVDTFKSINSGFNRVLDYVNASVASTKVEVHAANDNYNIVPLDRTIVTDIAVQPKAPRGYVLRADLPAARGFNNNTPTVDVSAQLQAMLDAVDAAGGGIVYLPGGRYLVNQPITIPSGVELRGTRDVQSHIQGGGSAIFTSYGISQPNATPLIRIEADAGIRGLHIAQLGQRTGTIGTTESSFYECPFLIQGMGANIYAINITMPNADKGIDLASYKTDNHYIEYFAGSCARAGIWVGGGADGGFIRNWQGNPHYGQRFPQGTQGYPSLNLGDFQRQFYSSIKLGDVTNETIFFNFVFGSKNGIHFLNDEITGKNPKQVTVIGHGTDGSTYGMFVEDADADTEIVLINAELVTINYAGRMAYVLMGGDATVGSDPSRVHEDAKLYMYNTAVWGGATIAAIVNSGSLYMYQTNFSAFSSAYGVQVNGGKAHIYDSNFRPSGKTQVQITTADGRAELTNNYYAGGMKYSVVANGSVYGSDILPFTVEFIKNGLDNQIKITHVVMDRPTGGTLKLLKPDNYLNLFAPIEFEPLAYGESCIVDLPYYMSGAPFEFELELDNGRIFNYQERFDVTYADAYDGENSLTSGSTPLAIINSQSQASEGPWDGINDLSMEGNLKWDATNLYLYLVVTDDTHHNLRTGTSGTNSMEQIWNADSVQVAINMNKGASDGGQSRTSELGFGRNSNTGAVLTWRWAAATGSGSTGAFNPAGSSFIVDRDETAKTTTYDLTIPWASLTGSGAIDMDKLGISILVNDVDAEGGARVAMEYGTGLNVKSYPNLTSLHLLDAGEYTTMIVDSAQAAVAKAISTGLLSDKCGAYNFIALLEDGALKTSLINLLEGLTEVEAKPQVISDLNATSVPGEVDEGTVTFTWIDPNAAASAAGYYELYLTNGGNKWLDTPVIIDAANTTVVEGLTTATLTFEELGITKSGDYDFRIKAANVLGEAPFVYLGGANRYRLGVTVEVLVPTAKPKVITNFEAVQNGEAITFSWVNPNPDKSATSVESYALYMTSGGSVWLDEGKIIYASEVTVEDGITSITLTFEELGIIKSGNYDFRIKAGNIVNSASYVYIGGENRYKVAVEIESLVPTAKPKAITSFNAVAEGDIVTFSWVNPNNSATAVEVYELYRTNTGNTWQTPVYIDASDVVVEDGVCYVTYTFEELGIAKSGTYDFRIKATNLEGVSALTYLGGGTSSDPGRYRLSVTYVAPVPAEEVTTEEPIEEGDAA